jgi:multiple sugar transport system ATP-binding protein
MAAIEIANVTKVYPGDVLALDDVSLRIEDGEFIALVGPSGCGKSTLLRAVAGLEEVTAGEVSIGGRDVTDLAPRHRDIAMVFQSYALYPHMTVRQNLGYGLKVRRMPKAEIRRRVDEIAELLDLVELLERKPAQLSGGQRQRVAMGRAIVREPQASSWTSRSPISTPSFGWECARLSPSFTKSSASQRCTSPTTRWKR